MRTFLLSAVAMFPAAAYAATPFPLGVYAGGSETALQAFDATLGAQPAYFDTYIDNRMPISQWATSAAYDARMGAASPELSKAIPVIGMPMTSTASGAGTADEQYKAFAAGTYDTVLRAMVSAWGAAGYHAIVVRVAWEMNEQGTPFYVGTTPSVQADWLAAFRHVYTVLHAATGAATRVAWNPGVMNYASVDAINSLWPGAAYVDIIAADFYADMAPYTLWDFTTNRLDPNLTAWHANTANRDHYWLYPAATQWSNDSSGGHAMSLGRLISFAYQQGKPFGLAEVGCGNSSHWQDVSDEAEFPKWLASDLKSSGVTIAFVNVWDSNVGGTYALGATKPNEAAAWGHYFGTK